MRCGGCKAHPPADSDRNARQIRARYTGRHSAAPHVRSALPHMHCSHYSVGLTGSSPLNASGAMVQEQPGHRSATTACSCASNSASFCPHSYTRSPACEIRLRYVSYIHVYSVHLTGGVSTYMIVLYAPSVQDTSYVPLYRVYIHPPVTGVGVYIMQRTHSLCSHNRVYPAISVGASHTTMCLCMAPYTAVACNEPKETARGQRLP